MAVEDLNLRNMLRSAKGTQQQPGTNVRAKSGLNHSMSRAGLSDLHSYIEQAGRLRGVAFCPVHACWYLADLSLVLGSWNSRDPGGLLLPGVQPEVQR